MNPYGDFPSPRDPFDNSPRFDLFGAFAFLTVLILFGAMYVGLYSGPFIKTSSFELPDIFGTKAQEAAQKLLVNVAIPDQPAPIEAEATATPGPKTIVPVVPAEAAESAITIPFGIGAQPGSAGATPQPQPQATPAPPTPAPQTSEHAVGSRHRVANTNGDGVYVRRAPGSNDKIRAWPDNTVMEYQGELVDLQGSGWAKMKDPAGNVGWVPTQYLTPDNGPPPARRRRSGRPTRRPRPRHPRRSRPASRPCRSRQCSRRPPSRLRRRSLSRASSGRRRRGGEAGASLERRFSSGSGCPGGDAGGAPRQHWIGVLALD